MYRYVKGVMDFIVAFIALAILSPIFITVTILLFIANRGYPFYYQQRPGRKERIFTIIKFKSMNDRRGPDGNLLPDKERITPIGALVRKTSLDEIPQLINVLKGDMSFIGPRPLMVTYLKRYNDFQRRRQEVKPGITGWAQVNGRNAISWEKKFEYDVYYVDNMSLYLDLKILYLSFIKVFKSEGISADGQATMPYFRGNMEEEKEKGTP